MVVGAGYPEHSGRQSVILEQLVLRRLLVIASSMASIQGDSQTGVTEPPSQEQPRITAVTNGGVSIVPNSINDGPLVHMGTYFLPGFHFPGADTETP